MVGSAGWEGFDSSASIDLFTDQVVEAVEKAYPDYAIMLYELYEFEDWKRGVIIKDGKEIRFDKDYIESIISDVWNAKEWYVEEPAINPKWFENLCALMIEGTPIPHPEESKAMDEAGLILWYDYWQITIDGCEAM